MLAVLLLVALSGSIAAQNLPTFGTKEFGKLTPSASITDYGIFDCSSQSIYGQPPFLMQITGFPSIVIPDGPTYMAVDNFTGIQNPVAGITFWGLFQDGTGDYALPPGPVHFRIYFFGDFINGDTLYRADLYLTAQVQLEQGIPLCRFDAVFPTTVSLPQDGLISVVHVIEPDPEFFAFYWIASMSGDMMSSIYLIQYGQILDSQMVPLDWAFCLNQGSVIPLPLNNWAIFIGVLLIIATLIFRYRKYS